MVSRRKSPVFGNATRGAIGIRGAAAVALFGFALAGAAFGSTIGETSMKVRADHTYDMPSAPMIRQSSRIASSKQAPPNRYAIDTPQGRFEAYELSERGLYANARFAADRAGYDTPGYARDDSTHSAPAFTVHDTPASPPSASREGSAPAQGVAPQPAVVTVRSGTGSQSAAPVPSDPDTPVTITVAPQRRGAPDTATDPAP